jgi:lipopolysaccharide/colanic/teichoic acid biosynthesis glycosyltransferase
MRPSVRVAKRAVDIGASLVGLTLTAPLFPAIAAAIWLEDRGPVFYKQRRAGTLDRIDTDGTGRRRFLFREFHMHKFRSMRVDAEKFTGAVLAGKDDPRITRVGRFLRKTRLDELPQLLDVLRGTMSVVGPRPERPELLENLAYAIPLFEERMRNVKPGITGLAQVSLGYQGDIPEGSEIAQLATTLQNPWKLDETAGAIADDMRVKLLYDMAYLTALEHLPSYLAMEARIIVKTPWVMARGAGR